MLKARDYSPAVKHGAKWMPEDIAGLIGLPSVGNIYYVDPTNGSDTANSGTTRDDALATVGTAYGKCTSGNHDVVVIVPSGGTGRTTETSAITWGKRFTHLIGNAAPTTCNVRAGMSFTATGATTTPQFQVTENGCIFKNLTLYQAVADSYGLCEVSGDRNYFSNVFFAGIANTTAGDVASGYCLRLNAAEENTFDGCMFGVDWVMRTAANYNIHMYYNGSSVSSRNFFYNCFSTLIGDADAPRHIKVDSAGCDRYAYFENCVFTDNTGLSGVTTQTDVIQGATLDHQGGAIILKDCMEIGSTGWASSVTGVYILGTASNDTLATGYCKAINPAA